MILGSPTLFDGVEPSSTGSADVQYYYYQYCVIILHSDAHNFSMQYKDTIWCSVETFFQKERGRTVKNFEVEKILESFQHGLEELQGRAEDDKGGIIIDRALSSLEPPRPRGQYNYDHHAHKLVVSYRPISWETRSLLCGESFT